MGPTAISRMNCCCSFCSSFIRSLQVEAERMLPPVPQKGRRFLTCEYRLAHRSPTSREDCPRVSASAAWLLWDIVCDKQPDKTRCKTRQCSEHPNWYTEPTKPATRLVLSPAAPPYYRGTTRTIRTKLAKSTRKVNDTQASWPAAAAATWVHILRTFRVRLLHDHNHIVCCNSCGGKDQARTKLDKALKRRPSWSGRRHLERRNALSSSTWVPRQLRKDLCPAQLGPEHAGS